MCIRDSRQVAALTLRAPFDGQVGQVQVPQGTSVVTNGPVLSVVDLSQFEIEMKVPESFARDLAIGMPAQITSNGAQFAGEIAAVSPEVVNGEVTARVRFADGKQPPGPVSYTHLDVYKRQRPARPRVRPQPALAAELDPAYGAVAQGRWGPAWMPGPSCFQRLRMARSTRAGIVGLADAASRLLPHLESIRAFARIHRPHAAFQYVDAVAAVRSRIACHRQRHRAWRARQPVRQPNETR